MMDGRWIGVLFVLALAVSCGAPKDTVIEASRADDEKLLASLETRLTDMRFESSPVSLRETLASLDALSKRPRIDRRSQAWIAGLRAQTLKLMNRDFASAVNEAVSLDPKNEWAYVGRFWLENDPVKKEAILSEGLKKAPRKKVLELESLLRLQEVKRYAEAAIAADAWVQTFPQGPARGAVERLRDQDYRLARNGSSEWATRSSLTWEKVIELFRAELPGLSSSFPPSALSPEQTLRMMADSGKVVPAAVKPEWNIDRGSLAYLTAQLIQDAERSPKLLENLRARYTKSPVADVSPEDAYYASVIYLVEQGYMDLPDGVNFDPEGPVSGQDLKSLFDQLRKRYR